MKSLKFSVSLSLLALLSCASYQPQPAPMSSYRAIAKTNLTKERPDYNKSITELTTKIFHAYLMGQVALAKFDEQLDKNAESALSSKAYDDLQAIRILVDGFEDKINELYIELVLLTARPDSTQTQKDLAQAALDQLGKFMEGITTSGKEIPENLKPLVLANLTGKQTELYEELKALREDITVTKGDENARKVIYDNMVLLRATRRSYNKELSSYQVDADVLKAAIQEEAKKTSFKDLSKEIKTLAKEMKKYRKELRKGRSTSSDVFYPATTPSGNITGNGFPQNTWSITYDDGPGGKTTPTVLQHLKDKGLKATFFVLAKQVEGLPNTFKGVVDAGMDIGSHSYTHAQLTKLGPQGLEKEIALAKKVTESKLGRPIKLFRLPYGAGVSNANIRAKIAGLDMIHVFWNVDTLDWQDKNPQSILNRAIKQMNGSKNHSGVILFHDIHAQSVIASALLMDHMKKNNLTVCTVQGVVDQINKSLPNCQ